MKRKEKEQVVITVPVYKATLTVDEQDSLLQLFSVLGNHPVCLFTYRELDLSVYHQLLSGKKFDVVFFDREYFENINGYNLLMRSKQFYQSFSQYCYLLIYQLDAWVFNDQLSFWCAQNYDYIGAPWFDNWNIINPNNEFWGVGNGGFSLRKIESHLKALRSFSYIVPWSTVLSTFVKMPKRWQSVKWLLLNLSIRNNTYHKFNNYDDNEDKFWGIIVKRNFSWFKTPDMLTAAKFSLEINASMLYQLLNREISFGCHALEKHDPALFNELKMLAKN